MPQNFSQRSTDFTARARGFPRESSEPSARASERIGALLAFFSRGDSPRCEKSHGRVIDRWNSARGEARDRNENNEAAAIELQW